MTELTCLSAEAFYMKRRTALPSMSYPFKEFQLNAWVMTGMPPSIDQKVLNSS